MKKATLDTNTSPTYDQDPMRHIANVIRRNATAIKRVEGERKDTSNLPPAAAITIAALEILSVVLDGVLDDIANELEEEE